MSVMKLLCTPNLCRRTAAILSRSIRWTHNCARSHSNQALGPKAPSILATNLITYFFDEGLIKEARVLFDEMPERDVVTWTAMIAGYASCDAHSCAWMVFVEMLREGVEPNAFTVSSALKACKGMKSYSHGASVHGLAIKRDLVRFIYVDNALVDVYATCCVSMTEACMVFWCIHAKNAVSWTTLITGYTHRGDAYSALTVFKQMLSLVFLATGKR